jgi:hypothetical protein
MRRGAGRGRGEARVRFADSQDAAAEGRHGDATTSDNNNNNNNNRDADTDGMDEDPSKNTKVYEEDEAQRMANNARREKKRREAQRVGLDLERRREATKPGQRRAEGEGDDDDDEEDQDIQTMGEASASAIDEFDHGFRLEPFNMKQEMRQGVFQRSDLRARPRANPRRAEADGPPDSDDDDDDGDDDDDAREIDPEEAEMEQDPWLRELDAQGEGAIALGKGEAVSKIKGGLNKKRKRGGGDDDDTSPRFDALQAMRDLVALLEDGETPLRALKRLRPSGGPSAARHRAGGKGDANTSTKPGANDTNSGDAAEKGKQFDTITELADGLVTNGDMDVYTQTREQLEEKLQEQSQRHSLLSNPDDPSSANLLAPSARRPLPTSLQGHQEEDEEDMFATTETQKPTATDGGAMWEFKWTPDESAASYGPHSKEELKAWKNSGFFGSHPVVARPVVSSNTSSSPLSWKSIELIPDFA